MWLYHMLLCCVFYRFIDLTSCNNCIPKDELRNFGQTFDGVVKKTANNVPCMKWSQAAYYAEEMDEPLGFSAANHSMCRGYQNNGKEEHGPWCFTHFSIHLEVLYWEPCFIACEDTSRKCVRFRELPVTMHGYLGKKARSKSGRKCVHWTDVHIGEKTTAQVKSWQHNHCRAAPLLGVHAAVAVTTPWCFLDLHGIEWEECFQRCHDIATCMEKTETTLDYRGKKAKTVNNRLCEYWHSLDTKFAKKYPYKDSDENFCRNFGNIATGPFCFTKPNRKDGVKMEPCFEHCEDLSAKPCVGTDKLLEYWGGVRETISGRTCQRWDMQEPHKHKFKVEEFGIENFWEISNFCRNPDASLSGPWCHTTDPEVKREQCFVECAGVEEIKTKLTPTVDELEEPSSLEVGMNKWYIALIILLCLVGLTILFFCGSLFLRRCLFPENAMKQDLDEVEKIIRAYTPGRMTKNLDRENVENWTKWLQRHWNFSKKSFQLIDARNEYKRTHEFFRKRIK